MDIVGSVPVVVAMRLLADSNSPVSGIIYAQDIGGETIIETAI